MSNGKRYDVFNIIEKGEGQKSFWMRIGIAFTNRDGSLDVRLDALPLNGRLQIREPRQDQERKPQRGDADEGNSWVDGR